MRTRESRYFVHRLPDGTLDWDLWRRGERPPTDAELWFDSLRAAQEFLETSRAVQTAKREQPWLFGPGE